MDIIICSKKEAEDHFASDPNIRAAISIVDPPQGGLEVKRPYGLKNIPNTLKLTFDDVGSNHFAWDIAPSEEDIQRIINFATRLKAENITGKLLVHCHAGISRSSAAAFICKCVWEGPGKEAEILQYIYKIRPIAMPNDLMVAIGDKLLSRNTQMIDALREKPDGEGLLFPNLLRIARGDE